MPELVEGLLKQPLLNNQSRQGFPRSQRILDVNASVCHGIIADFTGNYIEGRPASATDNALHVLTDRGYADFEAAESAIEAGNASTSDYVVIFLNTTTTAVEVWADADSGEVRAGCHLATLDNITTLNDLADFVEDNVMH